MCGIESLYFNEQLSTKEGQEQANKSKLRQKIEGEFQFPGSHG